jgi:hypothetical protein
MTTIWKNFLTPTDQAWWTTQAALVAFPNYRNATAARSAFEFFIWYQFRFFDVHPDRYLSYPANAADFPAYYTPPWAPPTLEAPTIISATAPGDLTLRCLNVTPAGNGALPVAWFSLHPPADGAFPIGRHPWYWYARTDSGDHSQFTYDLHTALPNIRAGARGALVHSYAIAPGISTSKTANSAASIGSLPLIPWLNPTWATSCNNLGTSVDWSTGVDTQQLQCSDYAFPLLDAPILGIQLTIRVFAFASQVYDTSVKLMLAGVPTGDDKASATLWSQTGFSNRVYGGSTDKWGLNPTPNDLLDPGCGAALTAHSNTPSGGAYVDCMTLKVWTPGKLYQFTMPSLTPFDWL